MIWGLIDFFVMMNVPLWKRKRLWWVIHIKVSGMGCTWFTEVDQWLLLFCLQGLHRATEALAQSEKSFMTSTRTGYTNVQNLLSFLLLFSLNTALLNLRIHSFKLSWRKRKTNTSCKNKDILLFSLWSIGLDSQYSLQEELMINILFCVLSIHLFKIHERFLSLV